MDASPFRSHWSLNPEVTFLNHDSFGTCPTRVLEEQSQLRAHMEAEPARFLHRELETLADPARTALGAFLDNLHAEYQRLAKALEARVR